jgi:F-type H+-transporting ATPase subunit epsilon
MRTFTLKVSSPEGDLFCGNALKLSVRGTEGDLAVMAGHVPFVSYVKPCECKIELEDGEEKIGRIESGILSVSKDKVILLVGDLSWV